MRLTRPSFAKGRTRPVPAPHESPTFFTSRLPAERAPISQPRILDWPMLERTDQPESEQAGITSRPPGSRPRPIAYRTVGPRQFCLYYNTDATRISFQRGPAFSRGADQGSWDSVVEGCREALDGPRSTGCGIVRGELLLDVGTLVGELLPAAGCGKDMVTVSLDDQDPYLASPSVSVGSGKPKVSAGVRPGCRVEVMGERICRNVVPCPQRGP